MIHLGHSVRGSVMFFMVALLISTLVACGGSGSKATTPPPTATVAISMTTAPVTVSTNGTAQFAATVTGSTNTTVTWSVVEAGGGTISATGMYTSPAAAGTYHIKATSVADGTKLATVAITVSAPVVPPVVAVSINPTTASILTTATAQFTATVTGNANTAVTWTATGGTVIAGLFTPSAAGTAVVKATSIADGTKSATATITVTAPVIPVVVSVTPATASILTTATAQFTATVTGNANTAVAWTATGGTVSSAGLFTPTAAGTAVVTATSVADGTKSATATVTVTVPVRTILGSRIDTYWGANGPIPATPPNDLSTGSFAALVPNSDGSFTNHLGTGNADGTFTIPNVPEGFYWLVLGDSSERYWTDSSTFDLGQDFSGRQNLGSCDIALSPVDISGLDSVLGSWLQFVVPNHGNDPTFGVGEFLGDVVNSSTTFTSNSGLCVPVDPTLGDTSYIVQMETSLDVLDASFTGTVTGSALALDPTFKADAATTVQLGPLAVLPSNASSLNTIVDSADWLTSFQTAVPAGAAPLETSIITISASLQPFVGGGSAAATGVFGVQNFVPLVLVNSTAAQTTNTSLGTIFYNNPYPSTWSQVYQGFAEAQVLNSISGDTVDNFFATTTLPAFFGPIMSPIQSPKMNGLDLFAFGAVSDTTSVKLSWTAPTGLTPYGYEVSYYCVAPDCSTSAPSGFVYTASTSVTLPPDVLTPGLSYEFDIAAIADSVATIASSPLRSGYPLAWADVISAPLMINSNAIPATIQSLAVVGSVAHPSLIRSSKGSFMATKSGNKPVGSKARMLARFNQAKPSKAVPAMK